MIAVFMTSTLATAAMIVFFALVQAITSFYLLKSHVLSK
jgi:hypothetical protein